MLPSNWIGTIEMVLTGVPQLVSISNLLQLELLLGSGTFDWGFAGTSAGPFFPVPASRIEPIAYDTKMELWVQGAGTLSIALFGQGGPLLGNVSPPSTDVLLQENGFALLQENGSFILL